jgi:hypothetical protein
MLVLNQYNMTRLMLVAVALASSTARAQTVIDSSSGTVNAGNAIDASSTTYAEATDATACPSGWTMASGVCTLGSYSIEGWVVIDWNFFACYDLEVLHKSSCNPLNCLGSQKFYAFVSSDGVNWTYVGSATSSSTLVTSVFSVYYGQVFVLLGTDPDMSRPNTRWYDVQLGDFHDCF